MADTAPLPAMGDGTGALGASGSPGVQRGRPRPAPLVRAVEFAAGLLAGGLLVVGLVLLASQLFAPTLLNGTGYAAATGPGWWRVAAHLTVGLAGEAGVLLRPRLSDGPRAAIAGATILATLAVVAAAWWW